MRKASSTARRGAPKPASKGLFGARVLVVGLTPWGATAARDLVEVGVGAIHALTDAQAGGEPAPLGVSGGALSVRPGEALSGAPGHWDLVMACAPADDLVTLSAVARFAHARRITSMTGNLEGARSVIGPVVSPGRSACWECARRRRLAHADKPRVAHALHEALSKERPTPRERAYPEAVMRALGHEMAAEAVDVLMGQTSSLVGRVAIRSVVDGGASLHAVLPMPVCEVCGGASVMSFEAPRVRLDGAESPSELRRMLEGVVDEETGIVGKLVVASQDSPHGVDLPVTAHATLGAYSRCALHDHARDPDDGSGKGLSHVQALIGAVGEAVERYSASFAGARTIVRATARELTGAVVAPSSLALYSEAQRAEAGFPFARVDRGTMMDWALGRWLDTGEPVRVPALVAYYDYPAAPEEQFCQVTSNGLAAGATVEDASLAALLELVERDAYTITWIARLPATRVLLDESVGAGAREVARRLAGESGGRVVVYSLDVGLGVPTMMCVVFGDGARWPGASIAISSHLRPRLAIEKAILEQAQAGYYHRRLLEEGRAIPRAASDVHTLVDHALYYFPKERARAFDFLDRGGELAARDLEEPLDASLGELGRRVSSAGLRAVIVDVTSPDLRPTPFRVVRALGPNFQQIHFGHRLARLGNPRLLARMTREPNPDPHPLD